MEGMLWFGAGVVVGFIIGWWTLAVLLLTALDHRKMGSNEKD